MRSDWISIGLGIFGAAWFALAIFQIVRTMTFLRTSQKAIGVVVRLAAARSGRNRSLVYLPIVRFQTPDNETIEFAGRTASAPPSFSVGSAVRVNYPPGEPGKARIATFWEMWSLSVASLIVAAVVISISASLYLKN